MPLTPLHLPRTQEQDRDRFFFNIQCGQCLSTSLACKIDMEAGSFQLSTLLLPLLSRMQERDRCVSFECCQYLSTSLARKVETDAGCFQLLTSPPPQTSPRECHRFVNPCGLMPRVHTGTGTGWGLVTLTQPAPALRARWVLYMNVTCLMGIRRCPANIGWQCKQQTFLLYSTCGVDSQKKNFALQKHIHICLNHIPEPHPTSRTYADRFS